jgi:hypothetical protein
MRATRSPDGSFEVRGARYRLVETSDGVFEVVGEHDGAVAGRVRLGHAHGAPDAQVVPGASAEDVVKAIARLLSSPRGALPLQ